MTLHHDPLSPATEILKRDADQFGIDLTSAEYGYAVFPADQADTPEEAEVIEHAEDSGVHHG